MPRNRNHVGAHVPAAHWISKGHTMERKHSALHRTLFWIAVIVIASILLAMLAQQALFLPAVMR
jgi:hypothetical protein